MRKIIISLITVLTVGGLVAGATSAYFSDLGNSSDNTYATGSIDLKLSDDDETAQDNIVSSFGGTNLKPGDVLPEQYMIVRNSGTIDANHLDLTVTLPVGDGSALANALVFPYTPDSANGMRFGFTSAAGDSINMLTYLRGTYNDGDYDLQDGDTGASLYGALIGDTEITLQDIVNLGRIRIVPDSNNQGIVAGTEGRLWIHPNVSTSLTVQGETVTANFAWELHQDVSQF